MKIFDAILFTVLLILLATGIYFFFYLAPVGKPVLFSPYQTTANPEMLKNLTLESKQFYSNLRYRDKRIGYSIASDCNSKKRENAVQGFEAISEKTILQFYENDSNSEIAVYCSEIAPTAEEKDHFVAGEGGPSIIIVSGPFSVIFFGKVSLYRTDKCDKPQVATHEILHALGFDHNSNEASILYPITDCSQEIDQGITDDIDKIYSISSLPDLTIIDVVANRTNRYMNFEVNVSNIGLADSQNSSLQIYSGNQKIAEYYLNELEIGRTKSLSVSNLFASERSENLKFVVITNEDEISKDNNEAVLQLQSS